MPLLCAEITVFKPLKTLSAQSHSGPVGVAIPSCIQSVSLPNQYFSLSGWFGTEITCTVHSPTAWEDGRHLHALACG